jgi:hypothetical protein
MVFSLWLYQTIKLTLTKNTCQTGAILIAMGMRRCNVGRITQWSASVASCKATRCRHWASACAVSPRRPPRSTISKKTNKTQFLPIFCTVDLQKKLNNFETHRGPFTHVLGATSLNPNPYATCQIEAFSYI